MLDGTWAIPPIGACGWLPSPANAGEPSTGYSVPKVHWFVTLGRHFTPETLWSEVIHAGTG